MLNKSIKFNTFLINIYISFILSYSLCVLILIDVKLTSEKIISLDSGCGKVRNVSENS